MSRLEIESGSAEETFAAGERIGRLLGGGEVLGLDGPLGAGKTCLVRGLAAGLDLDPDVIYSPSFTLVAEHEGRLRFNHIDLFRLGEPVTENEAEEIGLDDYLEPEGVTAIEWAQKLGGRTLDLDVSIAIGAGDRRAISIRGSGPRGRAIVEAMRREWR
jgi:tRNA threonylcarbamoyladenosine biosynthesis protein TsaE